MAKGDAFWAAQERKAALKDAEAGGRVADSMDVRKALMTRVHNGEITLAEAQVDLAKIKRNASKVGLTNRAKAYRGA